MLLQLSPPSFRPRPERGELRSGSGQIRQQLHQPGQPRPGDGLRQVLLPHQGAVGAAEEPGESRSSALAGASNAIRPISRPLRSSGSALTWTQSLFCRVFPPLIGLGFVFLVKTGRSGVEHSIHFCAAFSSFPSPVAVPVWISPDVCVE